MSVFDAILWKGRVGMQQNPLPGCKAVFADDRFWGARIFDANGRDTGSRNYATIDPKEAAAAAGSMKAGGLYVVDYENRYSRDEFGEVTKRDFRMDARIEGNDGPSIARDMMFLHRLMAISRANTEAELGVYGFPSNYNNFNATLVNDGEELMRSALSSEFALRSVPAKLRVPFVKCPTLYAASDDVKGWIRWAGHCVTICRRIDTGCAKFYAFVSPHKHHTAGGGLVSLSFWETMLGTVLNLGFDGAIAWTDGRHTQSELAPYIEIAQKAAGYKKPATATLEVSKQTPVDLRKRA